MKDLPPRGALLLTAVLLISLNLRPAVAALSPLLETIRADLGLGYPALGLLTTIPVLCMGVFPAVAVAATARFGSERTLGTAIAVLAVAVAARLAGRSDIVLFGSAYWQGLLDWIKDTLLAEGKISPEDLELLAITDSPEEACRIIVECYDNQCWLADETSAAVKLGIRDVGTRD